MTNTTRRNLVPTSLAGAVVVVLLNTWLALHALKTLDQSQLWLDHTYEVMSQVETIMSSAKDAESGVRGFVNTGNPVYLEPYNRGLVELTHELDTFGSLTHDNQEQQGRLPVLRAAVDQRMTLLGHTADLRRENKTAELNALLAAGFGRTQMLRLREIVDDAEAEERRLLIVRQGEVRTNVQHTREALALASGLDLLLIFFIFRYFARERELRLISEATAASLALSREEVVRKAEEISALNVTLEERVRQRTAELENINKELEAFSYSVSHDLRAPLRTIDGFSLALEEDYTEAVDAVGRDYIKRVRSGVQRMGGLIDALLQLSRVTRAEISREEIDLTALAENVAANIREENPGRELNLTIEPGLKINGDPKLLRVALENLMGNSAKFTSKISNPVIHFGWDVKAEAYYIQDNGAGFDMHYAPKLFGAFNRLHGDRDFKGSGIGLATVARVIGRHQGRIWALGEVDRGARFSFTVGLPHER